MKEKITECSLCTKDRETCGEHKRDIRGCEAFKASRPEGKLLHSILYEKEYNDNRYRIVFYTEWLPILKALDDLFFSADDLHECFGIDEDRAKEMKQMCGELSEAIEDKLARM